MKTFNSIQELGNFCAENISNDNCGYRVEVTAFNRTDIHNPEKQCFIFRVTGAEEFHCLDSIVTDPLTNYGYTDFNFRVFPIERVKSQLEANALNNIEHAIRYDNMDEISNTELMLAWQQFFWMDENSGIHPDDWTSVDNGWTGWHVMLADLYFRKTECSDGFTYPSYIMHFKNALKMLDNFHSDDDEPDFINAIQQIRFFFNAADIKAIDDTLAAFELLVGYHSSLAYSEDDQKEEIWNPLIDAYFIVKEIKEMRDKEANQMFDQLMSDVTTLVNEK